MISRTLSSHLRIRPTIYLLVFQCIILCSRNARVYSKPMHGENVRNAAEGEFPFIVSLIRIGLLSSNRENDHFCTGVLITNQDVLTASHCLESEELNGISIIIGSSNIRTGIWYSPLWWITYNQWTELKRMSRQFRINDIANIRLSTRAPDNIQPAPISNMPNHHYFGLKVQLASWGNAADGEIYPELKTVEFTVISKEECENRILRNSGKNIVIHERRICTVAQPYAYIDDGDSGGPILLDGSIIGINEATMPSSLHRFHPGKVNIQTGVYYYMNFLLAVADEKFNYL